jgi:hypothetical protein
MHRRSAVRARHSRFGGPGADSFTVGIAPGTASNAPLPAKHRVHRRLQLAAYYPTCSPEPHAKRRIGSCARPLAPLGSKAAARAPHSGLPHLQTRRIAHKRTLRGLHRTGGALAVFFSAAYRFTPRFMRAYISNWECGDNTEEKEAKQFKKFFPNSIYPTSHDLP